MMRIFFAPLILLSSSWAFASGSFHCEVNNALAGNSASLSELSITIGNDGSLSGAYSDSYWGTMPLNKDGDSSFSYEELKDGTKHITISYHPGHDMYDYDISFKDGVGIVKEYSFLDCLGEAYYQSALRCSAL